MVNTGIVQNSFGMDKVCLVQLVGYNLSSHNFLFEIEKKPFNSEKSSTEVVERSLNDIRGLYRRIRQLQIVNNELLKPPFTELKRLVQSLDSCPSSIFKFTDHKYIKRKDKLRTWFATLIFVPELAEMLSEFCSVSNAPGYGRRKIEKAFKFGQYFTSPEATEFLFSSTVESLVECKYDISECLFIEPAAGMGAIFNKVNKSGLRCIGIDIDSMLSRECGWINANFLTCTREDIGIQSERNTVVISNPPYRLVDSFLVHSLLGFASIVAMIVPIRCQHDQFIANIKSQVKSKEVQPMQISVRNIKLEPRMQMFTEYDECSDERRIVKQPSLIQIWTKTNK